MLKKKKRKKEKNKICILSCPRCHKDWGKLKYEYATFIETKDILVNEEYAEDEYATANNELLCPACGYIYTNWDIFLLIASNKDEKI